MRVLSVIHAADAHSGLFGETVRREAHVLDERSYQLGEPPTEPLTAYDAVMVFGGDTSVRDLDEHPWMRTQLDELRSVLAAGVPTLGVCLGGQMLARAAGAAVTAVDQPEVGWHDVELTREAADDPVFGELASTSPLTAFQWHYEQFGLPEGATLLARSRVCFQAFRLGDRAWGMQFHPEVTSEIVQSWLGSYGTVDDPRLVGLDVGRARDELSRNIARWNEIGTTLCRSFIACAGETAGLAAAASKAS